MMEIQALTRREAAALRDVIRRPAARDAADVLVLEGRRLVCDALDAGTQIRQIVVDSTKLDDAGQLTELISAAIGKGVDVRRLPPEQFDRLSSLKTPPGVLALAQRPHFDLDTVIARPDLVCVAALGVQDPNNVGALARNALAFGIDALLLTADCADVFSPRGVRASSGSVLHLPVFRRSPVEIRELSRRHGLPIHAADAAAPTSIDDMTAPPRALVVFGAEGAGIPADFLEDGDTCFRIPIDPRIESLNITSAAAIVLQRFSRAS